MEQYLDFAMRHWYLFAALVAVIVLLIGNEMMHKLRGIKIVTANNALQMINDDDAVLIDIRDGAEYKNGHIRNAHHIPAAELKKRSKELSKFKDKPLIVYCRAGNRAGASATLLKKEGYETIHSLKGGLNAWVEANLPISKKK